MSAITDVKIVADPNKAPPTYAPLTTTHDTHEDADLWKDGFLRRVTRYLCITYKESDQVICDMVVCSGPQDVPEQFSIIEFTCDTQEKALKKKQLAVKMLPKASATSALNDIILLGKQKRPPGGYSIVGEFNSFTLCVRAGPVVNQSSPVVAVASASAAAGNPPVPPRPPPVTRQPSGSKLRDPLSGIPFEISKRWGGGAGPELAASFGVNLSEIVIKSAGQIESEYAYRFSLERQVCEQSLMDG